MTRLIIANGCSYTRGAELRDPATESWPAVLARRLGVPYANLASDGGSNRRAVRTTVENLDRIMREHGVGPADVLVLCMWTGLTRDEYRLPHGKDRGNRPDIPHETRWHRLGRWRVDEGDPASEAYFRLLWNEEGALVSFLTDWVLLDSFLRGRGVSAGYAFAWDSLPRKLSDQARPLLAQIDPASVYGGTAAPSENSFYRNVQGTFPLGRVYHPLADAHEYFAGKIADWILSGGPAGAGKSFRP